MNELDDVRAFYRAAGCRPAAEQVAQARTAFLRRIELEAAAAASTEPLSRRRVSWRRLSLAVAIVAAVAATLAVVFVNPFARLSPIERASAAISPPAHKVLHLRTETSGPGSLHASVEWWQLSDSPITVRSFLLLQAGAESCELEIGRSARNPQQAVFYLPASNVLVAAAITSAGANSEAARIGTDADYAAWMRQALASGNVQITGTATINGRTVYRLVNSGSFAPLEGIGDFDYYFDAETYAPVRLITYSEAGERTTDFTLYELLPANRSATALASIEATHPDATRLATRQSTGELVAAECGPVLSALAND